MSGYARRVEKRPQRRVTTKRLRSYMQATIDRYAEHQAKRYTVFLVASVVAGFLGGAAGAYLVLTRVHP